MSFTPSAEIDGSPVAKDPVVRHKIARLAIEMEVSRMLELRVVAATNQAGEMGGVEASMHKLFGTGFEQINQC